VALEVAPGGPHDRPNWNWPVKWSGGACGGSYFGAPNRRFGAWQVSWPHDAMGRLRADAGLRGDRDAGNSGVEDEPGQEHQGVEHLVVTEDGGQRVWAAVAVDEGTQ
jgi:hypothetical protein